MKAIRHFISLAVVCGLFVACSSENPVNQAEVINQIQKETEVKAATFSNNYVFDTVCINNLKNSSANDNYVRLELGNQSKDINICIPLEHKSFYATDIDITSWNNTLDIWAKCQDPYGDLQQLCVLITLTATDNTTLAGGYYTNKRDDNNNAYRIKKMPSNYPYNMLRVAIKMSDPEVYVPFQKYTPLSDTYLQVDAKEDGKYDIKLWTSIIIDRKNDRKRYIYAYINDAELRGISTNLDLARVTNYEANYAGAISYTHYLHAE